MKPKFIIGIAGVGLLALIVIVLVPASPVANATECNDKGVFYRVGLDLNHLDNLAISDGLTRGAMQILDGSSLVGKEIDTLNVWVFKNEDSSTNWALYNGTTFDIYIRDADDAIVAVIAEDQDIVTLAGSFQTIDYTRHKTNYEFDPYVIHTGDRISFEYADGDDSHYLGVVTDLDAGISGVNPQVFDGLWTDQYPDYPDGDVSAIIGNLG